MSDIETSSSTDLKELQSRVAGATQATRDYLRSIQREDGHWCGELEGDTILGSEYFMALLFLGKGEDRRVKKAIEYIRRKQCDDGGWAIYPGGPAEVSASVKAYFALKWDGDDPEAEHMVRARRRILDLGGIEACNSFTKQQLATFGLYDWSRCPAVPPEIILLPRWFYINIYEMSSWSRAILIPLSIIWAKRPVIDQPVRIDELFAMNPPAQRRNLWAAMFHGIDRGLKILEKLPIKPSRELAIKKAEQWILDRLEGSDGLGAIFPASSTR